jgi:RHS repeat-associated protein
LGKTPAFSQTVFNTTITIKHIVELPVRSRYSWDDRTSKGITPTKYRYTGQLAQAELGLDYYVARWYDPTIGHFTQADSIVPEPGKASAFDRYAYVLNNPIRNIDPTGHVCKQYVGTTCVAYSNDSWVPTTSNNGSNGKEKRAAYVHGFVPDENYQSAMQDEYNSCGPQAVGVDSNYIVNEIKKIIIKMLNYDPFGPGAGGVQPSVLENATKTYYGADRVYSKENAGLEDIYEEIRTGNQVITDFGVYKDSSGYEHPAADRPSDTAHFARVLGVDLDKNTIYLTNSISPNFDNITYPPYLSVSGEDYTASTSDPENKAPHGKFSADPPIYQWVLIILKEDR